MSNDEAVRKAELLFLAANCVEEPTNDDPSWIHQAAASEATKPLAAWLREEAMRAATDLDVAEEALAFARAILGKEI